MSGSTSYTYRIIASNSGVDSPASVIATATTPAAPTPPAAPTGLVGSPISATQVDLAWTDVSRRVEIQMRK